MIEFFGAVVGVVGMAAGVAKNLGEIAEGGRRVYDFAADILGRFRKRVPADQQQAVLRAALAQAAALPPAEFDKAAEKIVELELPALSADEKKAATEYLKLWPARIRASFSRAEDPSGTTVPATFHAQRPEDIAGFIPPRPPVFREGQSPPEASRWILTERLGIGGFGEVWKARSKTMQNTFSAFKFCLDPASQRNILENELGNVELVKNELVDHPNIVKLMDANLDGDTPWLQYEYIPGGDLARLVATWADDTAVRAAMAVKTVATLADVLAHCHDLKPKRVIHRDMKPANVLIGRDGTLKITDFGISNTQARQALDEARVATVGGMTVSTPSLVRWANTPMYASPQQKDGEKPHPADDVHALGVMLYQFVLGNVNRPLNIDYIRVLERKKLCGPLVELVSRCIASDRADRYQHAGELAQALKGLPKKLIAEPVSVTAADQERQLYAEFDRRAADAKAKNESARLQFDRGDYTAAVATLNGIFHPALRDATLYASADQNSRKIRIDGLAPRTTGDDLPHLFGQYGTVTRTQLLEPTGGYGGGHRVGFVEMSDGMAEAIEATNGLRFAGYGYTLAVRNAKPGEWEAAVAEDEARRIPPPPPAEPVPEAPPVGSGGYGAGSVELYVGNLSWDTTNDDLAELFGQYGTVVKAEVVMDRETGRSRGFAFVEMLEGSAYAVVGVNGHDFQGRTLTVHVATDADRAEAVQSGGILVRNLAWSTTSDGLRDLFAQYGQVYRCDVVMDRDTGRSRGFAVVLMADESEAVVIEGLNGAEFEGRKLSVTAAEDWEWDAAVAEADGKDGGYGGRGHGSRPGGGGYGGYGGGGGRRY